MYEKFGNFSARFVNLMANNMMNRYKKNFESIRMCVCLQRAYSMGVFVCIYVLEIRLLNACDRCQMLNDKVFRFKQMPK